MSSINPMKAFGYDNFTFFCLAHSLRNISYENIMAKYSYNEIGAATMGRQSRKRD
jgi:hypothetical protein